MKKTSLLTAVVLTFAAGLAGAAAGGTTTRGETNSTFPKTTEATRDQYRPHVGLMAGVATPEGDFRAGPEYGVDVGFQPIIPFSLGAELTVAHNRADSGDTLNRTILMAHAAYNFGGDIIVLRDSYVGLGLGPVFRSDGTDVATAPMVGFDIPVLADANNIWSVGAQAKLLAVSGGNNDATTLAAMVKYIY
jgi:hypothetical protein